MGLNFKDTGLLAKQWTACCLFCLAVAFTSCESMTAIVPDSKIGNTAPKLVIHGYLSPQDTLVKVYVTESVPVFREVGSTGRLILEDARVVLSHRDREIVLHYDTTHLAYTLPAVDVGIFSGNTYRLRVEHENRIAEASTTIPGPPPAIASYSVDSSFTRFSDFFGRRDTSLVTQFTWTDPPGETNYYRVSGRVTAIASYADYDADGEFVERRGRVTIPLNWDTGYGRSDFQSDANHDGGTMYSPPGRVRVGRPTFWSHNGTVYASDPTEVRTITLMLYHTDEHYYRYHRSVGPNEEAAENPFAEPALLYTNVRGGLGVFGSYNSFSIDVHPPAGGHF